MDANLNQLEEKIRKSKCTVCGLLLSMGPLMVLSEDGRQVRCGRCEEIKCKTITRNVLYEEIAEALTFPCSYEKCKEKIPWGQAGEHEKVCPFRQICCPLCYQKSNSIEATDLQSHFTQAHWGNMKFGNIEFTATVKENTIFLLIVDNLKFLVYLVYLEGSTSYFFIVFALDPIGRFTKFNVQIRSDKNENILVSYLNREIVLFDERKDCYRCWKKECTLAGHPRSQAYTNSAPFDWESISCKFDKHGLGLLGNPEVLMVTIDLIADQSEDSGTTTTCQGHKNAVAEEYKEAADDEKCKEIDLPC